ncbi:MAG: ABC transporter substrate-binding protein [Acidimicrobiia bacterium]
MTFHPRQNRRRGLLSRREFLRSSAALGLSLPTISSILAACGGGEGSAASEIVIGTPASPAAQPLFDDNPMIDSGLATESGPLRIYNWADYINPDVIPLAEEALGAPIEITIFYNEEEAFGKLLSGELNFDVWFPAGESIGKAVAGKLIQPLNHDYVPNLEQYVWPMLVDPFYDQGSAYTVPYVVYQTGIGWRSDMVDAEDIDGTPNPWDVFWNSKYRDITGLYDDFRETMQMAMFRNGIAEPREATAEEVAAAADSLIELVDLMNIRYGIDGAYTGIPEQRFGLHLAWSGDMVNAQYYFPEGGDPGVLGYSWPARSSGSTVKGLVANDTMSVVRGAEHPVLAHNFLNWMLDEANSLENFAWLGYQPPQNGLDPETLVADEWIPPNLAAVAVTSEDFASQNAIVPTQLAPETEALWLENWNRVQSSA